MKHNLLRNFLALVLSGIMLAGAGCKNYDDDIDKINNRLDELYVRLPTLTSRSRASGTRFRASMP